MFDQEKALAEQKYISEDARLEKVPLGYKRTEVGVIPNDWDCGCLRDFLKSPPSYGVNAAAIKHDDAYPIYIRITDINELGQFSPDPLVSVSHEASGRYFLEAGDLVFARTGASVGKSYMYNPKDGLLVYAGFLIRIKPDNKRLNSTFLANYCKSAQYWDWVESVSMRSGQPGINGAEYGTLSIPVPPIHEQRTIATSLSDTDALIESLDRLIAKKRAIKQATMQQLLTGKTRLPGFEGEWETKQLGDIIHYIVGGGTPSRNNSAYWGNGIPWVTVKDFASFNPETTQESITLEGLSKSASHRVPAGTIILSTRMAVGQAVIYNVDVAINQDLKAIFMNESVVTDYIFHWFRYNSKRIDELGSGSTVKGLSLADLKRIEFKYPGTDEQTAIATVLSDMDAEIQALGHRRHKARQIKQGMMQQLLTGRVRLIEPKVAA